MSAPDPALKPFLKWAGGKRQLAANIAARMPARIEHYIEPFLGGGAIFLHLRAQPGRVRYATLSDSNAELINLWRVVQESPRELARAVSALGTNDEERYYAIRAEVPMEALARAARTLWLNRTCFNGLYRLNASGGFNVPFGRYKRHSLASEATLVACSRALQGVTLLHADFAATLEQARAGAVVYCDPPYFPLSATARFTTYDGQAFTVEDQRRLAVAFAAVGARGALGVLSNADVEAAAALYAAHGLHIDRVQVRRSISRSAASRGMTGELIVTTAAPAAPRAAGRPPRVRPA
jgi:DNA adenine methylase